MKYERLTAQGDDVSFYERTIEECERDYYRLKEYEDKIENGTLVELPCKVGDTVYYTLKDEDLLVGKIVGIALDGIFTYVRVNYSDGWDLWHTVEDIGKNIFLNKAEAEKRLAELKGE